MDHFLSVSTRDTEGEEERWDKTFSSVLILHLCCVKCCRIDALPKKEALAKERKEREEDEEEGEKDEENEKEKEKEATTSYTLQVFAQEKLPSLNDSSFSHLDLCRMTTSLLTIAQSQKELDALPPISPIDTPQLFQPSLCLALLRSQTPSKENVAAIRDIIVHLW